MVDLIGTFVDPVLGGAAERGKTVSLPEGIIPHLDRPTRGELWFTNAEGLMFNPPELEGFTDLRLAPRPTSQVSARPIRTSAGGFLGNTVFGGGFGGFGGIPFGGFDFGGGRGEFDAPSAQAPPMRGMPPSMMMGMRGMPGMGMRGTIPGMPATAQPPPAPTGSYGILDAGDPEDNTNAYLRHLQQMGFNPNPGMQRMSRMGGMPGMYGM